MKEYMDLLGLKATDVVTGFKGVVTSVCFDLYGCVQVALNPGAGEDGKLGDGHWFDAKRIKVTSTKPVMVPTPYASLKAGDEKGPEAKPAARSLPVR
jgi:hypothetical protein